MDTYFQDILAWWISIFLLIAGPLQLLLYIRKGHTALYGKYVNEKLKMTMNAKVAWFLQEVPSFLVPFLMLGFGTRSCIDTTVHRVLMGLFVGHYFQRSVVYPLLIQGGKPLPWFIVLSAVIFTTLNGFIQGNHFLYQKYPTSWMENWRFMMGLTLYVCGMLINLHSDHILRNLRKTGDNSYKIPKGGMFEYVSSANYFGEILEWFGYALACWSLPAFAFSLYTLCALGSRGAAHHRFYKEKFKEYPTNRKAVVPYFW